MIVIKLQGGLGNQLFQYAFGVALAQQYHDPVLFDLGSYYEGSHRNLDILKFNIDLTEVPGDIYSRFFSLKNRLLNKLKLNGLTNYSVHFEKSPLYYNVKHISKKNTFYFGYWQSPKYFSAISNIIRQRFQLKTDKLPSNYTDLINQHVTVAIHIRRGDYLNAGNAQVHSNLSADYYMQAVNLMQSLAPNCQYLVFSDDMDWVIENFKIPVKWQPVKDDRLNDAQTLMLMAACHHQIIANSTFSWWAAWLNTNPGKKVIAPKNWFANNRDASDLLLPSWITI
jgi:hypothetical protein